MPTFTNRLIGAAALRVSVYEDVEADKSATAQAVGVVLLSSLAAGLGSAAGVSVAGILTRAVLALLTWGIWAFITFEIGNWVLREPQTRSNPGELLRTMGFATAPGLIRILGIIPWLSTPVFVVSWLWMLVAMVVGVRQALDFRHTSRALLVCLVGWLVAVGVTVTVGLFLATPVS